jgi:2,3-bisphosphoglycerate-dependent phosphoglycerate mutase
VSGVGYDKVSGASYTLVLLRHGESEWNERGLFTGWTDVGLSSSGEEEAAEAGRLLRHSHLAVDVVHTSLLRRAIRTAELALDGCDRHWIPVRRSWRLNERHYGALQGKNKAETREALGDEQFMLFRRSFDVPPPADSESQLALDPRYRSLPPEVIPATECLKDVLARVLPYWEDAIVPDLRAGLVTLVAAHGNSLRALVKHLDFISDDAIAELNIPTGIPLVYQLDHHLRSTGAHDPALGLSGTYLDHDAALRSIEHVRAQGSATIDEPAEAREARLLAR